MRIVQKSFGLRGVFWPVIPPTLPALAMPPAPWPWVTDPLPAAGSSLRYSGESRQLVQYAQALHENTLGCVGTLSSVLTRAAKLAEADGQWTVGALERALLTDAKRTRILEEILEGEAAINPSLIGNLPRIKTTTSRHAQEVVHALRKCIPAAFQP